MIKNTPENGDLKCEVVATQALVDKLIEENAELVEKVSAYYSVIATILDYDILFGIGNQYFLILGEEFICGARTTRSTNGGIFIFRI